MPRCSRTERLEVCHRRTDGGNLLDNAHVRCGPCHAAIAAAGTPGPADRAPPPFNELVRGFALMRARDRCECSRPDGCH
jgi:hypothetical protein